MRPIDADALRERWTIASPEPYSTDAAEVLDTIDDAPTLDYKDLVPQGEWIHTDKHLWYKDEDGHIDEWRLDVGFHNGVECSVCHETFCVHCNPEWKDRNCFKGHYICSICAETSVDGHEKFCPNCGARMSK